MARDIKINITADGSDFINELKNINNASYLSEKTISQLSTQYKNLSIAQKKGAINSAEMATSFTDLQSKILKQANAYQILNGELKGLEKTQKLVANVLNTQLVYGADENAQKELFALNDTLVEKINLLKKEENEVKNYNKAQKELLNDWLEAKRLKQEEIAQNERVFAQHAELARKRREQAAAAKEEAEIARLTAEAVAEEARQKEKLAHNVMVALNDQAGILREKYRNLESQLKESVKTTGVNSDKTRKLADEMKNLSVQIQKANFTPFNVRIKNLLSSFVSAQAILWGVRSAFRLVTNTITDSMKAASAAEETWNLFITTFNDVETTAINVSTAIASSMGLATSTAQKALGVFGDLALGYGQTDAAALKFAETLTKSTLDLISYKNLTGSYDEIFSAIASGIAGNVENFRKYGVVITQAEVKTRLQQKGLDKLTGSSLQFAQMQERMNIFIEKTANAQGDMIKTMESTENVTRRLSEATKEWKENFGENWNKILTPVKSAIADYIESINRAREAEKQWAEGRTDISVYSDLNSEERRQELLNAMLKDVDIYSEANTLNALKKIMIMFNSSADEMISLYDGMNLGDSIGYLREPLERHENYYKTKNDRASSLEKEKTAVQEVNNAYKNFGETLGQIDGFDVHNIFMPNNLDSELKKIIESIQTSNATDKYASPIDVALGLNSVEDNFKAKLEAIKKLYEETYNFFLLQDGNLDNSEKETLKTIEDLYKITNKELDDHNAKIEAEKERLEAVQSAIQSITNAAESYQSKIADSNLASFISAQYAGKSESFISNETARANALASNFAIFDAQSKNATEEELAKLVENLNLANSAVNEYYDILQKQIELEEEAARLKDKQDKSNAYTNALISAKQWNATPFTPVFSTNAVAQGVGAEAYGRLYDAIEQMVSEMEEAGVDQRVINDSVGTIREQGLADIRKIVENTEEDQKNAWKGEAKDTLMGGLGEFGKIIDAFSSGGGGFGDLAVMLAEIVAQTEAFTRLGSILTDSVLPYLNAALEPFLPLIDMLAYNIQMVMDKVLVPLFPVFKAIAQVATVAYGVVQVVGSFLVDGIKIVAGAVITGVTSMINGVVDVLNAIDFLDLFKDAQRIDNQWAKDWMNIDILGNAKDVWANMNKNLEKISQMSMEIANNTDPSNSEALKIYQDLYNKGTLSATQYAGYMSSLSGRNYDSVGILSSGLSYQKRNGGTYVAKQNVNIQINGSNLSEDELTNAIRNALESNTYAKGVA